jgi:hypothetical protein
MVHIPFLLFLVLSHVGIDNNLVHAEFHGFCIGECIAQLVVWTSLFKEVGQSISIP